MLTIIFLAAARPACAARPMNEISLEGIAPSSPGFPTDYPSSADFKKLGSEITKTVRDRFYDPDRAAAWAKAHEIMPRGSRACATSPG